MALVAIPEAESASAESSNTYVTTIVVGTTAYSVPSKHYALIKAVHSGHSSTVYSFYINSFEFEMTHMQLHPHGGLRLPAGAVIYTQNNSYANFFIEVYTE